MKEYEIVNTTSCWGKSPVRRVTSTRTGNSYRAEREFNKGWTCECREFWDKIRTGEDDPHCRHIKACIEEEKYDLAPSACRKAPETEDVPFDTPSCTACGATERTKAGTKCGKQVYRCKSCKRRYVHAEIGFQKNKYSPDIVAGSLNMLMSGMSYRQVEDHVSCYFGVHVSHTTIFYWVKKYTALIKKYVDALRPVTGNVFSIDEAVINVKRTNSLKGKGLVDWLWTAIDPKTRLVLATKITTDSRTSEDVSSIINLIKSMHDDPKYIVSDSLKAYDRPIRKKLPNTVHLHTKSIAAGFTNMAIERYHNEIRENLKTRRGLGNDDSAQVFCDLLRIHHNFVRPHMGLGGKTPAEAASLTTGKAARGKYRSLISMAAAKKNRQISREIGAFNEKAEIRVSSDDVRVVPKVWLDNDEWRQLNGIMTNLGFVWLFNAYARYWICSRNVPIMPFQKRKIQAPKKKHA